jgi:hypothetical protein
MRVGVVIGGYGCVHGLHVGFLPAARGDERGGLRLIVHAVYQYKR